MATKAQALEALQKAITASGDYDVHFRDADGKNPVITMMKGDHLAYSGALIAMQEKLSKMDDDVSEEIFEKFIKDLADFEALAKNYLVNSDAANREIALLMTGGYGRKEFNDSMRSFKRVLDIAPTIIVPAVDNRPAAEQRKTSNAITLLQTFSNLILAQKESEGVMRLSGNKRISQEKFASYDPKTLLTADAKKSALDWGDDLKKIDVNDVVSTLKEFFLPSETSIKALPLSLGISAGFVANYNSNQDDPAGASLKFLCDNLPASHLAMLRIFIHMAKEISDKSAVNKMTTGNMAIVLSGMVQNVSGMSEDPGLQLVFNKILPSLIENAGGTEGTLAKIDTAIKAKNKAGDNSNNVYTSEEDLTQEVSRRRALSESTKDTLKSVAGGLTSMFGGNRGRTSSTGSSGSSSSSSSSSSSKDEKKEKEIEIEISRPIDSTATGGTFLMERERQRKSDSMVSVPTNTRSTYGGTTLSIKEAQELAKSRSTSTSPNTTGGRTPPPPPPSTSTTHGVFNASPASTGLQANNNNGGRGRSHSDSSATHARDDSDSPEPKKTGFKSLLGGAKKKD